MPWSALIAVGAGAALGAWLRWGLGLWFNHLHPSVPVGTLLANLLGGYVIGICVEFFGQHVHLPVEYRLFAITGFLGGLTTFSTFSAEAVALLSKAQYGWAALHVGMHLAGSLALTMLGIATARSFHG
jgi:fluoride exporter